MNAVAQTNIQLYNQLLERGLPLDELVLVHRAYELLITLYPSFYQADGKPFVAHGLGVASILAELDQPAEMLAVGLLHNVYGNADFGDGRLASVTPARRRVVREAVGDRVESLVRRFQEVRVQWRPVEDTLRTLAEQNETDRRLILLDVVDFLEKHVDQGVLYYADSGRETIVLDLAESRVLEVAGALGEPRLVEMLTSTLARVRAARGTVPVQLRPSGNRRGARRIVPRSCRRRLPIAIRDWVAAARGRVRLRTRLRGVLKSPRLEP